MSADAARVADVVVIGSGIAGLSLALKVAARGHSVLIVTKKERAESNTNYAQGGIASVWEPGDDVGLHVQDTLTAGDGLCAEAVVRAIVEEGPERVRELAELGVAFSRREDGRMSLGQEGGHSRRRILHVADLTGHAIEAALLGAVAEHPRIRVQEHLAAVDLITAAKLRRQGLPAPEGDRVLGLYALDVQAGGVQTLGAAAVVLATGGSGQMYPYTTNPEIATGDGIAMAYRAGVPVANLEFVQFHPTALFTTSGERFLISEAVRGEGAILRNVAGEAFMGRYDARADLAPRDIVARAIDAEMKRSGARHVWLDIRGRAPEELEARFPTIAAACRRQGLELSRDLIPVVPAAHYQCGGVKTTLDGETALAGLYACGEVACTGLHGANRLASNSLLEAVVVAHRAAAAVADFLDSSAGATAMELPAWVDGWVQEADERVVLLHNFDEVRRLMWDYVGIVRSTKRLERARARLELLRREIREYYWNFRIEPRLLEVRNLIEVATLMVDCALARQESRGLHWTLDHPGKLALAEDTTLVRVES